MNRQPCRPRGEVLRGIYPKPGNEIQNWHLVVFLIIIDIFASKGPPGDGNYTSKGAGNLAGAQSNSPTLPINLHSVSHASCSESLALLYVTTEMTNFVCLKFQVILAARLRKQNSR